MTSQIIKVSNIRLKENKKNSCITISNAWYFVCLKHPSMAIFPLINVSLSVWEESLVIKLNTEGRWISFSYEEQKQIRVSLLSMYKHYWMVTGHNLCTSMFFVLLVVWFARNFCFLLSKSWMYKDNVWAIIIGRSCCELFEAGGTSRSSYYNKIAQWALNN